ncbi:3-oxoacyl-[acyl-carrier-protein] reductase FabG [compost metagenome]
MLSWNLSGKTALVSGASQGIGEATALILASRGARVIALARNEEKLKGLVSRLSGEGHSYIVADLAKTDLVEREVLPQLKGKDVQILINNAGGPQGGPLLEASIKEFDEPLRAHLLASHLLVQACVPQMTAFQYGRIINIISTSVKNPIPNLGVSNTVRGAMASWSKTLAGELGVHGITVNNVLPGYIKTGRLESLMQASAQKQSLNEQEIEEQWKETVPLKRIGRPEEVAEVISFLVSPAASYVNGINVPVDGGRTPSL